MKQILDRALSQASDMIFLALTIWREARGESEEVQRGVAFSILNRMQKPAWWNSHKTNDVPSVVFKRLQYSSLTHKYDPQLRTWPPASDDPVWLQCIQVASEALSQVSDNPVAGANSYYDVSISPPVWATKASFVVQLGRICFHEVA